MHVAGESSERIRGFDGLRAIAVLLVFVHHKTSLSQYDLGSYGVWLFFVLSGFLIVNILHNQRLDIEAGTKTFKSTLLAFMSRRTLRIFPIYYFVLIATVPMFLHGHTDGGRRFAPWEDGLNFLYLSNVWIGSICHDLVGPFSHLWTLSIEEQFYLFGSVAILALPSRWTIAFCGMVCAVGLAAKLGFELAGVDAISLYTSSPVNFAFIAFGGLSILSLKDRRPAAGRSSPWGPVLLMAYLLAPFILHWSGQEPTDRAFSQYTPLIVGPLLINVLKNQKQVLVHILEIAPLKFIGKISYGFYLYHNFITIDALEKVERLVFHRELNLPGEILPAVLFLITIAVSAASWHLIERPILDLRTTLGRKPSERSLQAAG